MRTRTIAATAVAGLVLTLTACSSGDQPDKPTATVTASATVTVDPAAARQACVDAWLEAIKAGTDSADSKPAACDSAPAGQAAEMYLEAVQQSNQAGRDRLDACLDSPTCTEMPVP